MTTSEQLREIGKNEFRCFYSADGNFLLSLADKLEKLEMTPLEILNAADKEASTTVRQQAFVQGANYYRSHVRNILNPEK